MVISILFWYVVASYLVGSILFVVGINNILRMRQKAIAAQKHTGMDLSRYLRIREPIAVGACVLLLSPLITWHGVLHYLALAWCRYKNVPFKPWI